MIERMQALRISPGLVVPADELKAEFARAGGPGGQNVNRTESKVVLRFCARTSRAFDEGQHALLLQRLGRRLTRSGDLVIHASRYREQARNLADARERLAELLRSALSPPRTRKPTRPTKVSRRARLSQKRARSEKKQGRSRVTSEE